MNTDLPLDLIDPNPDQPRQEFEAEPLELLADSIRTMGVLQPIKVTKRGERYLIVMGERRWRASKLAGCKTIPAVVQDRMSNLDVMVEAIVENNVRRDVTPLEEAIAYQRCLDEGLSVEELAEKLGFKQAWRITERTDLLKLRPEYQTLLKGKQITASQAYEMAQLSPAGQDALFK